MSQLRDDVRSSTWESQVDEGRVDRIKELEASDGAKTQTSRIGQGRVLYKLTNDLKKALEDKEKEICQAKEVTVLEYRDSDAHLLELEVSYNDGFNEALRQVKALYPKLDVSSVNISVSQSKHPFNLPSQRIQMSFLEMMSSSLMPLWTWRLKVNQKMVRPVKSRRSKPLLRIEVFYFYHCFSLM